LFLNFNNFRYFNLIVYNLLNRDVSWNFSNDLNYSLDYGFMRNDSLFDSLKFYKFVNNFLNDSVNLDIDVLFNNYFLNFSLNNWNLNNPLDFFDSFFNHDLGNNSFNNLWNLNNFLDNTRYNNYSLNYFLNFNNFWYLNHLFNDLFDWNFNLFNTVNMSQDFNDLFLYVFDWFGYFNVVVDNLLDLDYLRLFHNKRISNLDNDWYLSFNNLNTRFLNYLLNLQNSFMNNGNFNYSFDLFRNFLIDLNNFSDNFFNLFDSVNRHYFLDNNFNCKWSIDGVSYCHNFFNNLRYFNDSFFSLDDNNRFFDDSINYYVSNFNVILDLFSSDHFDLLYNLFNNFLNLNDFWHSHYFLDNLFDVDWDFHDFLNNLFDWNDFLLVDNYFFNFNFNMINNFSDHYWLFNFNDFLNNSVNSMHFGDLSNNFNDSVLDSWNLNCFFDNFLN